MGRLTEYINGAPVIDTKRWAMNRFHCKTIAQFKIMSWLMGQGITKEDIALVEPLSDTRLRVTNPAGQYMDLAYNSGVVRIDQAPEGEQV